MLDRLFQEILMARRRVYAVGETTPLERIEAAGLGSGLGLSPETEIWIKREDLSPIHAYKWRGAYNRMAILTPEERERGVITASAGNHAQGVAIGACKLGVDAKIFMPLATPRMKQLAVKRHGGDRVEVVLTGDTYDAAAQAARAASQEGGMTFVHAYDDLVTMGGQGTLADEVVMSGRGEFDVAFLQIGGGGMASAVACWLKRYYPNIKLIGVEGVEQASMKAAFDAGKPVELEHIDVFCDGTAVKRAGDVTYPLCHKLLDNIITVTNEEVCAAIQTLWEQRRCIPEPAGAMGLAGLMKSRELVDGKRALCILCGANIDFNQLAWVAQHAGIGAARRRYFRFEISEKSGSMLQLLETALSGVNIIEFQYGKTHNDRAWPVIGFEASPPELDLMGKNLRDAGIPHEDVTSREDVEFRMIHYSPELFERPYFIKLEFPERTGALHDFLDSFRGLANLCYFNYTYTGERVGRALLGFEFKTQENSDQFRRVLKESGRTYREISPDVIRRII